MLQILFRRKGIPYSTRIYGTGNGGKSLYSVVMDVIEVCPAVFWGDVRLKKDKVV